jgi:hypothetical protein
MRPHSTPQNYYFSASGTPFCGLVVKSSWLQIQRPEFGSRHYQIFWEVVSLERGPLSLVSTIEEQLERKSKGSCLESREYGRRDPSRWPGDKSRSLGLYSSLANSDHGVCFGTRFW